MNTEFKIVVSMALLRLIAGSIEVGAALLMLRLGRVESAARVNATLGLIGPTIFLLVSSLGLVGLAGSISPSRILVVATGVGLVFLATR
ncbi:MAG: YqhV family protein [Firmicutes bacterium]|nr:YqhV family protein [Bacillota bacterium]